MYVERTKMDVLYLGTFLQLGFCGTFCNCSLLRNFIIECLALKTCGKSDCMVIECNRLVKSPVQLYMLSILLTTNSKNFVNKPWLLFSRRFHMESIFETLIRLREAFYYRQQSTKGQCPTILMFFPYCCCFFLLFLVRHTTNG